MKTCTINDFFIDGEILTDQKYSEQEYLDFLVYFKDDQFEIEDETVSVYASLAVPSKNRICNIFMYAQSSDELVTLPTSKWPKPLGSLQFTLWQDKGPMILRAW
jgi:hypothetical protein